MQGTQLQRPIKDTLTLEWAERTLTSSKLSPEKITYKRLPQWNSQKINDIVTLITHILLQFIHRLILCSKWNLFCDMRPPAFPFHSRAPEFPEWLFDAIVPFSREENQITSESSTPPPYSTWQCHRIQAPYNISHTTAYKTKCAKQDCSEIEIRQQFWQKKVQPHFWR